MSQITDPNRIEELAKRLIELRKRQGLSQKDLSDKTKRDKSSGVTAQQIWRIETGKHKAVRTRTVEILARALGVTPEILTGQASLPESESTRPERPSDEDYSINVSVNGAVRNAFTLTALRYRVPIARIVELAPFLFVLAAEASLQRRRSKLKELQNVFDNAQHLAMDFLHLPSSLLPSGSSAPELHDEEQSILFHDILAERLPDNESIGAVIESDYDESQHNPFVIYLRETAKKVAPEEAGVASIRGFGRSSSEFDVCYEDALKLADGDEELAMSIITGEVILHKIPRELFNNDAFKARIGWIREKRDAYRAYRDTVLVASADLL